MDELIKEKFRNAMVKARGFNHLTQTDLAKKINKSTSLICDIEKGRKNPSMTTMVAIAEVLNISLDNTFLH